MVNYLRSIQDEISYVKALCRQMESDGISASREEGYIKAKIRAYRIPEAIYERACLEYYSNRESQIIFSNKEAAVQACMDALDLALVDFDFDPSEYKTLLSLVMELGINTGETVSDAVKKHIDKSMEANKAFEDIISTIIGEKKHLLDEVFPTKQDRLSFLFCLQKVIAADGIIKEAEQAFVMMMGRVFNISQFTSLEAVTKYKLNKDVQIEFTNEYSKLVSFRESIRVACTDNDFDVAEKETILEIAKELNIKIADDLLSRIDEAVKNRYEARKLRDEVFKLWLESLNA